MTAVLIFGGSFDPIHYGHLKPAITIQEKFCFERFIFLPCKYQVLKKASQQTEAYHRIKMLELALSTMPKGYHFEIDSCEIERKTPSYTVLTLQHFRKQLGTTMALTLLMGADAFASLTRWYQWEEILKLANILVIHRAGSEKFTADETLKRHETKDYKEILNKAHGVIYHFDAGSFDFSSTIIRLGLSQGQNVADFLPASVLGYIMKHQLYPLEKQEI